MKIRWRVIAAFIIAPIAIALVLLLIIPFMGLIALSMSAAIGYPIAIIFGIPSYFLLKKLGRNGLLSYSLIALLISITAFQIMTVIGLLPTVSNSGELVSTETRMGTLILFSIFTLFSTMIFWLIARPDKHDKIALEK